MPVVCAQVLVTGTGIFCCSEPQANPVVLGLGGGASLGSQTWPCARGWPWAGESSLPSPCGTGPLLGSWDDRLSR